ncbi:MAG: hypothetical protein EOP89_00285 [Lysobacteraceae bacterium]|nr:MAG: hypothetical protein EOP89_00285 [Xanthomonadaceae bacterium]
MKRFEFGQAVQNAIANAIAKALTSAGVKLVNADYRSVGNGFEVRLSDNVSRTANVAEAAIA